MDGKTMSIGASIKQAVQLNHTHARGIVCSLLFGLTAPLLLAQGASTGWCNYRDGRGWVRCGDYPAHRTTAPPAPPQPDPEVVRQQQEAAKRRAEEEERQRRAEEERRRQEAFELDRDEAAKSLKGRAASDPSLHGSGNAASGLKGTTTAEALKGENTAAFGLKGTSAAEAAAVIKVGAPDQSKRDVSTAWKQIHCAAELTDYALAKARGLAASSHPEADVDEIRYLSKEALNALNGSSVGVQCSSAPSVKFVKTPDPKQLLPVYQSMLERTVKNAQTLAEAEQKLGPVKQKLQEAKERVAEATKELHQVTAKTRPPAKTTSADDAAIAKAAAEQKAYQTKEQEKINQVYKEQQQKQKAQLDAMAILREMQRQYNEVNSSKYGAQTALDAIEKKNQAVLAGNLPQTP